MAHHHQVLGKTELGMYIKLARAGYKGLVTPAARLGQAQLCPPIRKRLGHAGSWAPRRKRAITNRVPSVHLVWLGWGWMGVRAWTSLTAGVQ